MELEASWHLKYVYFRGLFVCFFLMLSFFYLLLRYLDKTKLYCNCETCQTYLKSSWSENFDNLCDWYAFLLKKSPTKTIHIHVLGNVITADQNNVEYILKTRFENYPKGKPFSKILGDFLGRGIFNVDGDLWRFQKHVASQELTKYSLRTYAFEIFTEEIEHHLVSFLAEKENIGVVLDLQDVFRRFSFDCMCKFLFGVDPISLLDFSVQISEFSVAFDLASKLSAERAMSVSPMVWKVKRMLGLGSEKQLKDAISLIDIFAREIIRNKRKIGFSNHKDLLSRFMGTINDERYLRDIIISFLLAGRDTVASALTSFFWLLSNHPHVEEAILREADRVIGNDKDVLINFEQLRELHYLQASMYESMRLYPPIQFDSKFCEEDDVLPDGTFVKRGTRVTYHQYAMSRIEEIWGPDCLEFKPERWLRDGIFFSENPYKYPVFQAGHRICLGKEIALVELKCVAFSLIRRFRIELETKCYRPRFSPGLTATFSGGLLVAVRKRETP